MSFIMKTDLRIIKSKQAIEEAFLSLVEIKGYNNVTLTEVAKKARVNRNTIYLHYESKEGIVESIITGSVIDEIKGFDFTKFLKSRNNRAKIEGVFRAFLNTFDENIELYRVFITDQSITGFLYREIQRIKKLVLPMLKPTIQNELALDYMLNGIFGIFSTYVVYAKGSLEENVKALTDLTIANLKKLTL